MKRMGGILVLIGGLVLIGLVGVQYGRQQPAPNTPSPILDVPPHDHHGLHRPHRHHSTDPDEVELPLLEAMRDLLDQVGHDLDDDDVGVDEMHGMLDEIEGPWRHAKADMWRGIHEANRKFEYVQEVGPHELHDP